MAAPNNSKGRPPAAAKPADTLAELVKLLKSPSAPPVFILMNSPMARGDEPWLHEMALQRIVKSAEARGAEVNRYDGAVPGFDPATLYAELTTRSLFAMATVRILKNADALMKGMRDAGDEDGDDDESEPAEDGAAPAPAKRSREAAVHPLEKAILAFMKNAPAGDALAVTAKKLRAPFVRAAREGGAFIAEFRPLYDKPFRGAGPIESTEFGEFAQIVARDAGVTLGAGVLSAMVRKTGSQLSQVAGAIEKLKSVAQNRDITIHDVAEHVPYSRPGSPWVLAEAILSGDAARAFFELEALGNAGARDANGKIIASDGALVMALSSIARDGRRNVIGAELLKRGMPISEIASIVGLPSIPAVLETFEKQLKLRTPAGHRQLLDWVVDTELATRLRGEKARSAMERLATRARDRRATEKK